MSAETALAGSLLEVERVRARIGCRGCGVAGEVGNVPIFACMARASTQVSVVAGDEFLITSLDLEAERAGVSASR